jgi:hypothetical protein
METVHFNVDMGQLDSSIPNSKRNGKDARHQEFVNYPNLQ